MPCAVAAYAALGNGSVREADEERQPNPRMLMESTSRKRGASERACLRRFSMAHLHYVLFYYYHTFMYQYMINAREPGFSLLKIKGRGGEAMLFRLACPFSGKTDRQLCI